MRSKFLCPRARRILIFSGVAFGLAWGVTLFSHLRPSSRRARWIKEYVSRYQPEADVLKLDPAICSRVLETARAMTTRPIRYDPGYYKIAFPGGDVADDTGVCADVIVRSLRAMGLDLQNLVNEDMKRDFESYPALWSLRGPDPNIDHRRVPNLMAYFQRHEGVVAMSRDEADYAPCDIVAWDLGGGVTHIGLVSDRKSGHARPLVIHHIGGNPTEEDVLFEWDIIGHFRIDK